MRRVINEIKKSIVFLGKASDEGKNKFLATGFFVRIGGKFHIVTAKHVVVDKKTGRPSDEQLRVFFNTKDGKVASRSIAGMKQHLGVEWMFHDNSAVDVAILPFGINTKQDDVKVIPQNLFLKPDSLFELYEIFFLSYQPGVYSQEKIAPVIRTGIISLINDDKTFYIDGSAFPGNSGSPVFLKASLIKFTDGADLSVSLGKDPTGNHCIGIVGEYIPYQEFAYSEQTGRPRIMFEENTGLSKVWSCAFINEIMGTATFQQQLEKLAKFDEPSKR